ncbi:hypothetical protein ID867_16545 [Streptomyces parvulus]|nr:hypothetical protein [Streptomyces parvulus]
MPRPPGPRSPLRLPAPPQAPVPGTATAEPHRALLAPAPPMLRHPLALQRALRPLKRRADAPVGREVDESATADRIARLGADPEWWLPVLRPVRERWLRLNLVHDAGPRCPCGSPWCGNCTPRSPSRASSAPSPCTARRPTAPSAATEPRRPPTAVPSPC